MSLELCVNTNSNEFKDTMGRLNISSSVLEHIIDEGRLKTNNPEYFPSDDVILSKVMPQSPTYTSKTVYEFLKDMREKLSPNTFEKYEDALAGKGAAEAYGFPEYSVKVVQRADDTYEVVIAEPKLATTNTSTSENTEKAEKTIQFNEGQKKAIDAVNKHIKAVQKGTAKSPFFLVKGAAGTGKTTIINPILEGLSSSPVFKPIVVTGALSHKATMVIGDKMSKEVRRKTNLKTKSIAGMLGLKEKINDDGTKEYVKDPYNPSVLEKATIAVIDEASMIGEKELNLILKALEKRNIPVILLGDQYQLPPVRAGKEYKGMDKKQLKSLSPVFTRDDIDSVELTDIVRQGEGSPIIDYAYRYVTVQKQDEIKTYPTDVNEHSRVTDQGALIIQPQEIDLVQQLLPLFEIAKLTKNPNLVKIVAYTVNEGKGYVPAVAKYNKAIREALYPNLKPEDGMQVGDLVIALDNFSRPEAEGTELPNSYESSIIEASKPKTDDMTGLSESTRKELGLKPVAYQDITIMVKYQDGSMGELQIPVILDTPQNKANFQKNKNILWANRKEYPELKRIAPAYSYHTFASLGYAYAINAHKSQGSTYDVVAVDCADINSCKALDKKAKAQATYVGITRASNVTIMSSETCNEHQVYTDIKGINDRINDVKAGTATEEEFNPQTTEFYANPEITEEQAQKTIKERDDNSASTFFGLDDNKREDFGSVDTEDGEVLESGGMEAFGFDDDEDTESPEEDKNKPKGKETKEKTAQDKSYDNFVANQSVLGNAVEFNDDNHTYKVYGKLNDFSVTEFKDFVKTGHIKTDEEKEEDKKNMWLQVSSRIGTTHDIVLRDFFMGQLKDEYTNLNDEQLEYVISQAEKLKEEIQEKYGENAKFITDEKLLRVASNITYNGKTYLVAGTMDMVVIPDGSKGSTTPVVVDFKTMRSNTKKEMPAGKEQGYAFQTTMYAKMLGMQINEKVEDRYLAQFNVEYADPSKVKYTGSKKNKLLLNVNKHLIEFTKDYKPGTLHKFFKPDDTFADYDEFGMSVIKSALQQGNDMAKGTKETQPKTESKKTLESHFSTHKENGYRIRTKANAEWSDITLALAVNYNTGGESDTKKFAGDKYAGSKLWKTEKGAPMFSKKGLDKAVKMAKELGKPIKLNIAGNGMQHFAEEGWTQEEVDKAILNAVKYLTKNGVEIEEIRSGGQTGADEAGIKAAQKLGIEYSVLAPKGWGFRTADGKDHWGEKKEFLARFAEDAHKSSKEVKEEKEKKDLDTLTTEEKKTLSPEEKQKLEEEKAEERRKREEQRQLSIEEKKKREEEKKAKALETLSRVQKVEEASANAQKLQEISTPYYGIEQLADAGSFTARYILHMKAMDDRETVGNLRLQAKSLESVAKCMHYSSSFTLSGHVNAKMLITIDTLLDSDAIYMDGYSQKVQVIPGSELDDLATDLAKADKRFPYNPDTHELSIPKYTVGFTRKEIEKRAQMNKLLDNDILTPQEIRNLAKGAIYKASEIITVLGTAKIGYEHYFKKDEESWEKDPHKDKDFTKMSRIEIVKEIGLGNILNVVRDRVFGADSNDGRKLARKKTLIRSNWEAFREQGYDTLIGLEEIAFDEKENVSNDADSLWEGKSEQEIQEIYGSSIEHWQVGFRQVSSFNSLSQMIKRTIDNLYQVDEEGNVISDEFGLGQHLSPQEATSQILYFTQGARTIDDMVKLLKDRAETDKWLTQIVDLLEGPKSSEQFRSQFFTNFKKYFQKYTITYYKQSKEDKKKHRKGTVQFKVINESNYADNLLKDCKAKENAFAMGGFPLKTTEGKINKEAFNRLSDISDEMFQWVDANLKKEELIAKDEYHPYIKEALQLLGIDVKSEDNLNRIFGVKANFTTFAGKLHYLLEKIADNKGDKNITDLREFKQILDVVAKGEDTEMESVSYEAGKMYYSYVLPNYLGKLIEKLRSDNMNEKEFEEWMDKEFGQYEWFKKDGKWRNHWLKLIANGGGADSVRGMLQHVTSLHYLGTEYSDKTPADYIASMMKMYFYDEGGKWAYYRVPMMANKPSEEYIRCARYRDGGRTSSYKKFILDRMYDIFTQETDRIKAVRERNGFIEGIDAIEEHQKIKNFDERGLQFLFEDYLPITSKEFTRTDKSKGQRFVSTLDISHPKYEKSVEFAGLVEKYLADDMGNEGEDMNRLMELFREFTQDGFNNNFEEAKQQWIDEGFITLDEEGKLKKTYTNLKVKGKPITLEDMEEFYWNDAFASMNIHQITLTDIAYYGDTEDLQKRLAQIHAPGMRADINATFEGIKFSDGTERTIYLKDDEIKSDIMINLKKAFHDLQVNAKTKEERASLETMEKNIMGAFAKVNVADAQGYSSPTSYRKKMGLFGKWDARMEKAYQMVTNPESIQEGESLNDYLDILWQPLKPFVYTQVGKEGYNQTLPKLKVGIQNKNSEYTLIMADAIMRSAGRANKLSAIYDFMEESQKDNQGKPNGKGIDTVQFQSTVKAGMSGVIDINDVYDKEGNLIRRRTKEEVYKILRDSAIKSDGSYNFDYVHEIPFEDYMIQQEVPAHFRGHSQAHGSQDRILTFADMLDIDPVAGDANTLEINGETLTVAEAKKRYFKAIADNIHDSMRQLEIRFGLRDKDGNTTVDKRRRNKKLSDILKDTILRDSRFGSDMLWACDLNEYGEFNIPLSDPIHSNRIQQLLNSVIKNSINKQEIAGGPVVQVTGWGTSDELHIRFRDDEGRLLLAKSEFENDEFPDDYAEKYAPKLEGQTYEEYIQVQEGVAYFEAYAPIQDEQIVKDFQREDGTIDIKAMEKANPKLLEMIGYRIPTESKYSMAPIRIKGFLPRTAGEGIMLPAEITTLAGSDYDVDKEYLMRYQLVKDKKTGKWVEPVEGTRAWRDNYIISTQMAVLRSEQVMKQLFTPGNFDSPKLNGYLISYVQNRARKEGKSAQETWEEAMVKRNSLKDDAKFTKWLKAENKNASNLCFNQTQVQFHKQNMTAGKLIGVFAQANVSHAFVSLESSQCTGNENSTTVLTIPKENAFRFVDVDVNGSFEIDAVYSRDGKGAISNNLAAFLAASVDAVKDPILNLANINSDTANIVTSLLRMGFDIESVMMFSSQPIIKELVKEYGIRKAEGRITLDSIIDEMLSTLEDSLEKGVSETEVVITRAELINNLDGSDLKTSYNALRMFRKMQGIANTFGDITHMTRYNSVTAAVGPFATDTMLQRIKVDAFRANEMITPSIVQAVEKQEMLEAFREDANELEKAILGNNMIQATLSMDACLKRLGALLNYTKGVPSELANAFSDFYMSYYVNASDRGSVYDLSPEHREYMLKEFPDAFVTLKEKFHDNLFIKSIRRVEESTEEYPTLKLETRGMSSEALEDLKQAWVTLFNNSGEEGRNMAMLLIEYNFFRHGFGFSPKTFTSLIPNVIKTRAIPHYMATLNARDSSLGGNKAIQERMIRQFILHNPDSIRYKGKDVKDYSPEEGEEGTIFINAKPNDDNKHKAREIKADPNTFFKLGDDIFFVEEYIAGLDKYKLRKVDHLGGNGQGFEIDLNNDFPKSIYSQEKVTYEKGSRYTDFDKEEQAGLSKETIDTLFYEAFEGDLDAFDDAGAKTVLNKTNKMLADAGINYTLKDDNATRQLVILAQRRFEQGIFKRVAKTINELDLNC